MAPDDTMAPVMPDAGRGTSTPGAGSFLEIATHHDTWLIARPGDGMLVHASLAAPVAGAAPVLAWRSAACPHLVFLMAGESAPRTLRQADRAGARRVLVMAAPRAVGHPGRVVLRDRASGLHACAEPSDQGAGALPVNRVEAREWELFRCEPARAGLVTVAARLIGEALAALLSGGLMAEAVLARIAANRIAMDVDVLAAVIDALPADQRGLVEQAIGVRPGLARGIAAMAPGDPWLEVGLAGLEAHAGGADFGPVRRIGPAFDFLAKAGFDGAFVSAGQRLVAEARARVVASKTLCIVATARNEGLYLLEWIAYHKAIGVEHIFLYSNDNDDGSDALLEALARAGEITWIQNETSPGVSPQYKAYGHAMQMLADVLDYRWAAVIDIDEFVVFDTAMFSSLPDFIAWHETQAVDAIALSWVMFGAGEQIGYADWPVSLRFRKRAPTANPHVKSLFRPSAFVHAHCHYPVANQTVGWTFRLADGTEHTKTRDGDAPAFAERPNMQHASVHHYHTKSVLEFVLRKAKNRGDTGLVREQSLDLLTGDLINGLRHSMRADADVHDPRAASCVPQIGRHIEHLLEAPGVREAMPTIHRLQEARKAALLRAMQADPRFASPDTSEAWLLNVLSAGVKTISSDPRAVVDTTKPL